MTDLQDANTNNRKNFHVYSVESVSRAALPEDGPSENVRSEVQISKHFSLHWSALNTAQPLV